jgi:uncharacterized membrane protein
MRLHLARCLFALGFVLAAANSGALAQDTKPFTTIDIPGGTSTVALDINDVGDIVGRFCLTTPCQPGGPNVHGFLLSDGEFTTIDVPGANGTNAWKINARGDIVGGYTDADGRQHVFLLPGHKRGLITVDVPGVVENANGAGLHGFLLSRW